MAEADQQMRRAAQNGKQPFDKSLDENNSLRLKQILESLGSWPTISLEGEEASYAAWLIAQHADHDVNFQEECLNLMLNVKNEVLHSNIAYLTDRVAVNKGLPQTFGTQFYQERQGRPVPRPINKIKELEKRRQQMGLEPFSVYEQKMRGEYK